MKPFLTERDKQLMLVTMVIQAMVNISDVVLQEVSLQTGCVFPVSSSTDKVCCCGVLDLARCARFPCVATSPACARHGVLLCHSATDRLVHPTLA